jgi:hypothetical protein
MAKNKQHGQKKLNNNNNLMQFCLGCRHVKKLVFLGKCFLLGQMCWTLIPLGLCLWVKWLCFVGELLLCLPYENVNHVLGGRVSVVFEEYGCVPWGNFSSLGTNVLIVVLTKEIVVFHGEYGCCVFFKEMQLYSWQSVLCSSKNMVCVPQRNAFSWDTFLFN